MDTIQSSGRAADFDLPRGVEVQRLRHGPPCRLARERAGWCRRHGGRCHRGAVPGASKSRWRRSTRRKADASTRWCCLGCLIRGETAHFEFIASAVSHGLTTAARATGIPMAFACSHHSVEEALARRETAGQQGARGRRRCDRDGGRRGTDDPARGATDVRGREHVREPPVKKDPAIARAKRRCRFCINGTLARATSIGRPRPFFAFSGRTPTRHPTSARLRVGSRARRGRAPREVDTLIARLPRTGVRADGGARSVILRDGACELLRDPDTPPAVVINERSSSRDV